VQEQQDSTLEGFMKVCEDNAHATRAKLPNAWAKLAGIHDAYKHLLDTLYNTPDHHVAMFLLRAHSAFLAACRLALSGQAAESYMATRSCLEAALYGVFVHKEPDAMKVWLDRHVDKASRDASKRKFALAELLNFLEGIDRSVGERLRALYEDAIDRGGHPNERAILGAMRRRDEGKDVFLLMHYATGDPHVIGAAVRSAARAGLCALEAFRNVYGTRMELTGFGGTLRELRNGLET